MDGESILLLEDYLGGNDEAARKIFDRYVRRLVALANSRLSDGLNARIDAEDIVQSAYRSFFRRADEGEVVLQRSGDLWRLLAAFTVNKAMGCIEFHLAEKRNPATEVQSAIQNKVESDPGPEDAAILLDLLESFLDGKTEREKRVLTLRLEGRSVGEIADAIFNEGVTAARLSDASIRRVLRVLEKELRCRLFEE